MYACILRMFAWINSLVLFTTFIMFAVIIYLCYHTRALGYRVKLPCFFLSGSSALVILCTFGSLKISKQRGIFSSSLLHEDPISGEAWLGSLMQSEWISCSLSTCWFGQTSTYRWQTLTKISLGNSTVISHQGEVEQMEDPLLRYLRDVRH